MFVYIQTEQPLAITGSRDDSGTQHPFDLSTYNKALVNNGSSTASMNLFWTILQWTPTPGAPLRASAIEQMSKTMFRKPTAISDLTIAVSVADFNPLMRKGALLRVSPDEITTAFVLAVARDFKINELNTVLRTWMKHALSATGKFVVSATTTDRYWHSLQQREWFSVVDAAVRRATFQRIHEINRRIEKRRETLPATEATSATSAA